jgi:hypothetical protein
MKMSKKRLIELLKEALKMWPITCCGCGCCCGADHGKDEKRYNEVVAELKKEGIDIC